MIRNLKSDLSILAWLFGEISSLLFADESRFGIGAGKVYRSAIGTIQSPDSVVLFSDALSTSLRNARFAPVSIDRYNIHHIV